MPIARVQLPDGSVGRFEVPEGTTPIQAEAFAFEQFKAGKLLPPPDAIDKSAMEAQKPTVLERVGRGFADVVQGATQLGLRAVDAVSPREPSVTDLVTGPKPSRADEYTKEKTAELALYEKGRGKDAGVDWMRLAGNVVATLPAMAIPGGQAAALGTRAVAGAAQGALSSATMFTPEGESKLAQTLVGAGFGAAVPAVIEGGKRAILAVVNKARPTVIGIPALEQELRIELQKNGVDFGKLTTEVQQSLVDDAKRAMQVGGKLDPAALERKAVIESVGAKPTRAAVTRNPKDWQTEHNLRGVTGVGEPIAARQGENAAAMTDYLSRLRQQTGGRAATPAEAGESVVTALRTADESRGAAVDAAYRGARDEAGRYAAVDANHFSTAANTALDEGMLGRWLPENVRGLMNDVANGKTPLNVNTMVQIDSVMSEAQRTAARAGDRAGAKAIGVVRDALNAAPLLDKQAAATAGTAVVPAGAKAAGAVSTEVRTPGVPGPVSNDIPGEFTKTTQSAGEAAKEAFDNARGLARERFAAREASPALQAAVDDVAPDKFVKRFVFDADARDLRGTMAELRRTPEGRQAIADVKGHLFDNLLMKATGATNPDDVMGRAFSGRNFSKALDGIAPEKLHQIFTPSEVDALRRLQSASKYLTEEVPFSDVNHSKTTAALANILLKIGSTPLLGQIVSPIIGVGKLGADWVKDAAARKQVAEALLGSAVTAGGKRPALPVHEIERVAPGAAAAALNEPRQGANE